MAPVKNQHYVPQFYLKKFASTDERLYVFDKFSKRSFQTSVRNIASGSYFYDFHPDIQKEVREKLLPNAKTQEEKDLLAKALDPQMIEHELGEREASFKPVFDAILDAIKQGQKLTDEQKWHLAEFIVLQILRTPETRKANIQLQTEMFTALLQKFPDGNNLYVEYDERRASLDHAGVLFNPDIQLALCKTLLNHIWIIGENVTTESFYTSDTPVVKRSHTAQSLNGVGYGSFGVEIVYPLTPKYILTLYEKIAFGDMQHLNEAIMPFHAKRVQYVNSLQALHSYRHIFCPVGEFLLAADLANEYPEVCNPERAYVWGI